VSYRDKYPVYLCRHDFSCFNSDLKWVHRQLENLIPFLETGISKNGNKILFYVRLKTRTCRTVYNTPLSTRSEPEDASPESNPPNYIRCPLCKKTKLLPSFGQPLSNEHLTSGHILGLSVSQKYSQTSHGVPD
jgi:hypothetical protein